MSLALPPALLALCRCEPIRVTHSIPDSCGMILRSDHGTIVHTGDWKIDENPQDGQVFDRTMFEKIGETRCSVLMVSLGPPPGAEVTYKPSVWD